MRKFDVDEPPVIDEPIEDVDKCIKQIKDGKGDEISLEEKFYKYVLLKLFPRGGTCKETKFLLQTFSKFSLRIRYGVKPEWLIIHRIINHRTMKDNRTKYLVKWRDLAYDQATWEDDSTDIPGLKRAVEYYWVSWLFEVHIQNK